MEAVFRTVLNMSLTGTYVILAILLARLLLKKAPKKYAYALWSAAAFRLCCPVSFESILSLFRLPVFDMTTAQAENAATLTYIPQNTTGRITTGIMAVNSVIEPVISRPPVSNVPTVDWIEVAATVWCTGMVVMVLYSLISYFLLHRRLSTALRIENGVYESDAVPSPFILGFIRPKIYLPAGLSATQRECVLAHERMHLKRFDHIAKLFAYGVLALHWFNPACHLAFRLMSRDMEMSCDEAVLRSRGDIRKTYSATLVSLASNRTVPVPSPLAFGESGVRGRVKNILHWRKPKVWVSLAAAALCLLSLVACAANPPQSYTPPAADTDYMPYSQVYTNPAYSLTTHYITGDQNNYRITRDGLLYTSPASDPEDWELLGTLEEFQITKENFDDYFIPRSVETEDGARLLSTFDPEALRGHIVSAQRVHTPYVVSKVSYDTLIYYVLELDSGQLYIAQGFGDSRDPSHGQMKNIIWMVPVPETATDPIQADVTYVTSYHLYQSMFYSSVMSDDSGLRYTVEDGMFTVSSKRSREVIDSYSIAGRSWEPFPFTREEWEGLAFSLLRCDYEQFRHTEYLDISGRYFLLRRNNLIYLCEGSFYPSSSTPQIFHIYTLTTEGSPDDPAQRISE